MLGRARLVDYEPALTVSAGTVLQFEVGGSVSTIPHGLAAFADPERHSTSARAPFRQIR